MSGFLLNKGARRALLALVLGLTATAACGCRAAASPRTEKGTGMNKTAEILYVSPSGNDSWSGRRADPARDGKDGPFATLDRARDAIRRLKVAGLPPGGAAVCLRAGTYLLDKSFALTQEDSGTGDAPVVYRACDGEEVRLLGGRIVPPASFGPVTDAATLARLGEEARKHVLQADLRELGISDFGRLRSRGFGRPASPAHLEVFFDGARMTLARWPNGGYTKIADLPPEGIGKDAHGATTGKLETGFIFEGDRPIRWKSLDDVWVHGYWCYDWANTYEQIDSIDMQKHLLKAKPPYGTYGYMKNQRFYFLNILEELDEPGEYYVDNAAGVLYFWPPAAAAGAGPEHEVLASVLETPLISLRDASHVRLQGLTIEGGRGVGVEIRGGRDVRVEDCRVRAIGSHGVVVAGGTGHAVAGCEIREVGDCGVTVSGGDRKTLAPSGHVIHSNHIHRFSQWSRCYVPAIQASGVGIRMTHNLIHDAPHSGIIFNGNEMLIEFNEIHHVTMETGDCGAIYTGRDYGARGNVIRHNYIHDTGGYGMGSMAVYLDDCTSGQSVIGNLFVRTTRAVMIGGGRDNVVENNIFVDCDPAIWFDGRGLDKATVWHDMVYKTMQERLGQVNYHQPPYSERYPELMELDAYFAKDGGVPPENNVVARNICVGGTWVLATWHSVEHYLKYGENLVGADPGFVDAAKGDYGLKAGSPAWRIGFRTIPLDEIGLIRGGR